MVRVGGMSYTCEPRARMGRRISGMESATSPSLLEDVQGRRLGVASVAEGVTGEPIWDVVARYLRAKKTVPAAKPNVPRLIGVGSNPGIVG